MGQLTAQTLCFFLGTVMVRSLFLSTYMDVEEISFL